MMIDIRKAVMLALPLAAIPAGARNSVKPNIILIMTDQQTMSAMSCMGNPYVSTPGMDRLAHDGVSFTRAYCSFPLSGPSRSSLLTGMMPVQIGVTDNAMQPDKKALDNSIGHRMSEAGYDCLYAGKWHAPEIDAPESSGFTKVCGMDDRLIVGACRKALADRAAEKDQRPLFLVASFLDPHEICEFARDESLPYGQLPVFSTSDCPPLPENFGHPSAEALSFERNAFLKSHDTYSYSESDWRRYLYGYYRLIERVDARISELLSVLDEYGLYDNSLIVFCSDHGDGVAAHGWNQKWALYEECINVPLIVKAPNVSRSVRSSSTPALCNIGLDLYSTFCDYAGVQLDTSVYRGKSFRRVAEGRSTCVHDNVVVETYLSAIETRGWALIDGDFKYVLYQYFQNREALYDLSLDKGETHDLSRDPAYSKRLAELRRKLYNYSLSAADKKLQKQLKPLIDFDGPSGHVKGNY